MKTTIDIGLAIEIDVPFDLPLRPGPYWIPDSQRASLQLTGGWWVTEIRPLALIEGTDARIDLPNPNVLKADIKLRWEFKVFVTHSWGAYYDDSDPVGTLIRSFHFDDINSNRIKHLAACATTAQHVPPPFDMHKRAATVGKRLGLDPYLFSKSIGLDLWGMYTKSCRPATTPLTKDYWHSQARAWLRDFLMQEKAKKALRDLGKTI